MMAPGMTALVRYKTGYDSHGDTGTVGSGRVA